MLFVMVPLTFGAVVCENPVAIFGFRALVVSVIFAASKFEL